MNTLVRILGAGLAGSEAALQLAYRGIPVQLVEMRPLLQTAVHHTKYCAELVCSNSFKSTKPASAAGMLKEELKLLESPLYSMALRHAVPAGGALAVNRESFSQAVTQAIENHPLIHLQRREAKDIVQESNNVAALVVTAGPLVSPDLAESLQQLTGKQHMAFYDAAAPIVMADSLDYSVLFRQSRYENPLSGRAHSRYCGTKSLFDDAGSLHEGTKLPHDSTDLHDGGTGLPHDGTNSHDGGTGLPHDSTNSHDGGTGLPHDGILQGDYLNAPMNKDEYELFIDALLSAKKVITKNFENKDLFQACQPIEEIARAGRDAPRFGPLKPVGLVDPRSGRRPWAVLQLRAENAEGQSYNLVGFQTNLTFSEQRRVFSMIPGLEHADFARFGVMHRNTFLDAPCLLNEQLQLQGSVQKECKVPVYIAGQLAGTEGYVEAIRSGAHVAISIAAYLQSGVQVSARHSGQLSELVSQKACAPHLPRETAFGALLSYATDPKTSNYQPMHVNFGIMPPLQPPIRQKKLRYEAYARRGNNAMREYVQKLRDCSLMPCAIR